MSRKAKVATVSVVTLGVVLLGISLWQPRSTHRINEESLARIREGMTEDEVDAVFGVPAGDYTHRKVAMLFRGFGEHGAWHEKQWIADDFCVVVCFDETGKVREWQEAFVSPITESLLDKCRRWLGLSA